eukprot:scaffold16724_cov50-Prasinocladus_malaysianus.AAC.1
MVWTWRDEHGLVLPLVVVRQPLPAAPLGPIKVFQGMKLHALLTESHCNPSLHHSLGSLMDRAGFDVHIPLPLVPEVDRAPVYLAWSGLIRLTPASRSAASTLPSPPA